MNARTIILIHKELRDVAKTFIKPVYLDRSFLHRSLACEDLFLFSLSRFCHARLQPRPQARAAEIAAAFVRYRLRKSHEDQKECKVWISANIEIINKIRKLIRGDEKTKFK